MLRIRACLYTSVLILALAAVSAATVSVSASPLDSFDAMRASECLAVPYSPYYVEGSRASCIGLSELDRRYGYREDSLARARFWRSAMDYVPGAGPTIDILRQITGYTDDGRITSVNASRELTQVLERFKRSVTFEIDPRRPETITETMRVTLEAYESLAELLNSRAFGDQDRKAIQAEMERFRNLGSGLVTEAMVELITATGRRQREELLRMFTEMSSKFETRIGELKQDFYQDHLSTREKLREEIQALRARMGAAADAEERVRLSQEVAGKELALAHDAQQTLQRIDNYTDFARGLTAVYSIVEPEKSARLDSAIQGISTISKALVEVQGMSGAAALGPYGMIAMGSMRLISAFSSQSDSQSAAFKGIFKQLQAISRQIERLHKQMNEQFSRLRSEQFVMERNILGAIARMHADVQTIEQLSRASFDLLRTVEENLRHLQGYVANRDVTSAIKSDYLASVERCLGDKQVSFDARGWEARECHAAISRWATKELSTSLLTRRSLPGQYDGRRNLSYQINDLLDHYRAQGSSSATLPDSLPNPELLLDAERSLRMMEVGYFTGRRGITVERSAIEHIEEEKRNLHRFFGELKADRKYAHKLISQHEEALQSVHAQVKAAHASAQLETGASYHRSEMRRVIEMLDNELIYRQGERDRKDLDGPDSSAKVHAHDHFHTLDQISLTSRLLKRGLEQDQGYVFIAEHCRPGGGNPLDMPLPIPAKPLREKLGDALYERMLLNPRGTKVCYDFTTARKQVVGYVYTISPVYPSSSTSRSTRLRHVAEMKEFEKVSHRYLKSVKHPESGIAFGRCRTVERAGKRLCHIVFTGEIITKLTLRASFEGKEVLNETKAVFERVPLRKGVSDRFALLAIMNGASYPKGYPYEPLPKAYVKIKKRFAEGIVPRKQTLDQVAGLRLPESVDHFAAARLSGMASAISAENMRRSLNAIDQGELLEKERQALYREVQSRFAQALEQIRTTALDEAGRMMNLALYFRDPSGYAGIHGGSELMDEVWGLRSGRFLLRYYADLYSVEPEEEGLEQVLRDQMEKLRKLVETLGLVEMPS